MRGCGRMRFSVMSMRRSSTWSERSSERVTRACVLDSRSDFWVARVSSVIILSSFL